MHCQTCFANRVTGCEFLRILRVSFVQRDYAVSMINILNEIINSLRVVPFICDESAAIQREILIRLCKDTFRHGTVRDIGRGCNLGNRKSGNAVDQDMAFVAPIVFKFPLIDLIGSGMNTEHSLDRKMDDSLWKTCFCKTTSDCSVLYLP